eukprot:3035255-Ditylum_brightwellii.AAC.1
MPMPESSLVDVGAAFMGSGAGVSCVLLLVQQNLPGRQLGYLQRTPINQAINTLAPLIPTPGQ